ncbi:MAG: DinB family protein [Ferruginibacter sp.]
MQQITAKKTSLQVLINLYDFHTKLFYNVIVDITNEDASKRLDTKANHVAWLAGSLVNARFDLAKALGINEQQTTGELFKNNSGIQDNATYPSLSEYKKDWENISTVLKNALDNLDEDKLNGPDPFGMPGVDMKLFDSITFLIDRESYCIGQVGLWRRLLGYDAMKYD